MRTKCTVRKEEGMTRVGEGATRHAAAGWEGKAAEGAEKGARRARATKIEEMAAEEWMATAAKTKVGGTMMSGRKRG